MRYYTLRFYTIVMADFPLGNSQHPLYLREKSQMLDNQNKLQRMRKNSDAKHKIISRISIVMFVAKRRSPA